MKNSATFCNQLVTAASEQQNWLPDGNFQRVFAAWRRLIFALLTALALSSASEAWSAESWPAPLRFGITAAILHNQHQLIGDWAAYLSARLGRLVEFVSRDRYSDMLELLKRQEVDFAWLSDYPYVMVRDQVKLLAVPVYQGKPTYTAYLIVPASDTSTHSIRQLKGTIFAYADPISHTGYLVPRYQLQLAGEDPNTFFRKTFFAWSHRNVIEAVATGLAQGGSVDAYVWESAQKITPELTARTRIVGRSAAYAFPPIVARNALPAGEFHAMQNALLQMAADPAAQDVLKEFNLDGFTTGKPSQYDPVDKLMRAVGDK